MNAIKALKILNNKFEEYFLAGTLAISVALIFVQVVMRYVFKASISWSEELARYLFLWQIWIGSALAVKRDKHIRVDILKNYMSLNKQKVLDYAVYVIWIFFLGVLSYNSFKLTGKLMKMNQLSPALRLPMWIPYASIPVGCVLTVFRLIQKIWRERGSSEKNAEGEGAL